MFSELAYSCGTEVYMTDGRVGGTCEQPDRAVSLTWDDTVHKMENTVWCKKGVRLNTRDSQGIAADPYEH